ncbi:unnamed protein product [Merluccius merluccius]
MWRYGAFVLMLVGWSGQASHSIICPDGRRCSDISTCCKTPDEYSCCPYPNAVCCSDLANCCPHGYRCDYTTRMCEKAGHPLLSVPMRRKAVPGESGRSLFPLSTPSHLRGQSAAPGRGAGAGGRGSPAVVHCEEDMWCPGGATCCRGPKGGWFCCPVSSGYCCADGVHCCEHGYTCDSSDSSYVKCRKWFPHKKNATSS